MKALAINIIRLAVLILFCLVFGAIAVLVTSCAGTTVYSNGQPIFRTQANMTESDYSVAANGAIRWTAKTVNHSTPTRAGSSAVSNLILKLPQ